MNGIVTPNPTTNENHQEAHLYHDLYPLRSSQHGRHHKNSNTRYGKGWTSAQISRDYQSRAPSRARSVSSNGGFSTPAHNLRDRRKIQRPNRYKSPSVTSSGFRKSPKRKSPRSPRGQSPLRQTSKPPRNPLVCHNCNADGHTSRQCNRPAHHCSNCNGRNHLAKFCLNDHRKSANIGRGRPKERRH